MSPPGSRTASAVGLLDRFDVVQVLLYKSEEDAMATSMVTGRMDNYKKERGAQVLAQAGLTASQAINLMYDRIISEQDAAFLLPDAQAAPRAERVQLTTNFVDSLSRKRSSRFDNMTRAEIKAERLASRGLM